MNASTVTALVIGGTAFIAALTYFTGRPSGAHCSLFGDFRKGDSSMTSSHTSASNVQHLDAASFDRIVNSSTEPVLVDFWATWCPPCRIIGPTVDRLAADHAGKAVIAKVDVDENQALASRYQIKSIPTLIVFRNGKEVKRLVGVQSKEALESALFADDH